MLRADRTRRTDPYIGAKMALFVAAAAFGIAGITTERSVFVYIALLSLVAGVVLRLIGVRRADAVDSEEATVDDED